MPVVEHAVIAAAGLGSRLGMGMPKCLVEVEGRPLIAFLLERLVGVPDVRIVVGFQEEDVIKAARSLRSDLVFVRNPAFRTTTTLQSYAVGARYLQTPCLFMDADIFFEATTFETFLKACESGCPLIGVTETKTADCVYVKRRSDGRVTQFSREDPEPFEWANLAWLPPGYCERGSGAVFERLSEDLPLASHEVTSYEFDTVQDLERVLGAARSH